MGRCSEQIKERNRLWKINNKEKYAAYCKAYSKKYRAEHYEHFRKYLHDYYIKNREKKLLDNKLWYKKNKEWACLKTSRRRAVYKAGDCTVHDWKEIQRKYQFKCLCCGKEKELTIDHVIPLKKGGKHTVDNIQPLCLPCNRKKGIEILDFRGAING